MNPVLHEHTTAVLSALRTGTGRPIGDGVRPDGTSVLYGVLYHVVGLREGDLSADWDAAVTYQVSCFAPDRVGAQWLAGECERTLTESPPAVPGRRVMRVEVLGDGLLDRDDDTGTPVFGAYIRARMWTTPSS